MSPVVRLICLLALCLSAGCASYTGATTDSTEATAPAKSSPDSAVKGFVAAIANADAQALIGVMSAAAREKMLQGAKTLSEEGAQKVFGMSKAEVGKLSLIELVVKAGLHTEFRGKEVSVTGTEVVGDGKAVGRFKLDAAACEVQLVRELSGEWRLDTLPWCVQGG